MHPPTDKSGPHPRGLPRPTTSTPISSLSLFLLIPSAPSSLLPEQSHAAEQSPAAGQLPPLSCISSLVQLHSPAPLYVSPEQSPAAGKLPPISCFLLSPSARLPVPRPRAAALYIHTIQMVTKVGSARRVPASDSLIGG